MTTGSYKSLLVRVPLCRVEGTVEGNIGFELWLPAATAWNRRLLGAGVGGDAGVFNYADLSRRVAEGFAAVTTDSGHKASDPRWMAKAKARVNYEHRATHLATLAAKALIARFYAKPLDHSYFLGCSGGGRQGLKEMQQYPADYDGIVAGAPGPYMPLISVRMMWSSLLQQHDPAALTDADWALYEHAATAACDAADGVRDGVVDNPMACGFKPAALACPPGETTGCLAPAKVRMLATITGPMPDEAGRPMDRGLLPGVRTRPGPPSPLLREMWADAVYNDPAWNEDGFRRTADLAKANAALPRPMEAGGWYPPPILGAFGATAGAARLLGLDARRTRDALSLALCQATAPGEIKHSRATTIRAVREAFPAQAAVTAAMLAEAGVVGFETPLEGEGGFYRLYTRGAVDEAVLLAHLGRKFHGEDVSFKRWPACRGTHAYIEAALALRERLGGDWQRVEAATVVVGDVQRMLVEPPARKQAPTTAIDAKFSIFVTVALALVKGEVGLHSFDDTSRADSDVLALAARMRAVHDPSRVPAAIGGVVALTLNNGALVEEAVAIPLGHPARPIPPAMMIDKFVACMGEAAIPCAEPEARALARRLLTLDDDTQVGALLRRTRGDG